MTAMRYSNDGFARVIGGAVKHAHLEVEVDTCGDFGYVTLKNGQVFRFEVREVPPEDAAAALATAGEGKVRPDAT